MEDKKITAKDMEQYLANRYLNPQWVFLPQVRSSTGSADRIADGMAFNMYRSTGYEILGFEIKVSRSDWLSELKDMGKSNELMSYCDKWYLVVSDASIVKEGELPKNWGLLVLSNGELKQKVRPTPQVPVKMPLEFVASLLRRNNDEMDRLKYKYVLKESIKDEIERARKSGYEDGRGYNGKRTEEELERVRGVLQAFEESSGIDLSRWISTAKAKEIGRYVKLTMNLHEATIESDIRRMEGTVKSINSAIADMKVIKNDLGKLN
jgi:hypothetical protein